MVSRAFYHANSDLPVPIMWYGDNPHLVRTARRNLHNWRVDLVFMDTLIEGVGRLVCASMAKLQWIADNVTLDKGSGLRDILDVSQWRDQKTDASFHLFSIKTIKLLEMYAPADTGTLLYMWAIYFISEVYLNKDFTCPRAIVQYVWAGHYILRLQELYITKCVKLERGSDCYMPSTQMRRTVKAMCHAATTHVLVFFRHRKNKPWSECGLGNVNQNPVEGLHSDGRCGQVLRNNDRNYTAAKWLHIVGRLQLITEKKTAVNAVDGWSCGQASNAAKSQSGKIKTLGYLGTQHLQQGVAGVAKDVQAHQSGYCIPSTYDQFVQDMKGGKHGGGGIALALWQRLLPTAVAQMKAVGA